MTDASPAPLNIAEQAKLRRRAEDERHEADAHAELTAKVAAVLEDEHQRQARTRTAQSRDYDNHDGLDLEAFAAAAVDVFFDELRSLPGN